MKEKARAAVYSMGGVYLLTIAYSIWKDLSESSGNEHALMLVAMVAFVAAGVGMIGFGAHMTHSVYKKSRLSKQASAKPQAGRDRPDDARKKG